MDRDCFLKVPCMPQLGCKPLRLPLDHDSFAPFVEAKFTNESGQDVLSVTVGNESYKQRPNTAVIKSMECGYMDKSEAVLEIVDEAGGEMGLFVDAIRKCGNVQIKPGALMYLKFGWVKSNCEGFSEEDRITFEGFIKLIVAQIDVSYGSGLVKYTVRGTALDVATTNQREDIVMGPGMRLTEAIERICASKDIMVVYASEDGDGSIKTVDGVWPQGMKAGDAPWVWNVGGVDGPRGSWQGDNNDVLSTISRWLEPYRAQYGKHGAGIKMVFDSKEFNRLYLWMDPAKETRCSGSIAYAAENTPDGAVGGKKARGFLGTYIVNGGKCSPVIKFDPKFNFLAGLARQSTGGNAAGSKDTKGVTPENEGDPGKREECSEDFERTGPENDATVPQHANENYPPNLVYKETLRSNMAHIKANMYTEFNIGAIQAEMTIMGNPTDKFVNFLEFLHAPVSVIVINPFFVRGEMNKGCGDWSWLANSGCNQILSDSKYICKGVNHSIREGSYTTTLRLLNVNKTTNVLK